MTRQFQFFATVGAVVVLAVAAGGCDSEASEQREQDRTVAPEPVDTLVLSPTGFTDTFEVLGTAEPKESVEVATEFAGEVLETYVDEGDRVDSGDPLFRIDTETDEAGQQVLRTQLDAAERELERVQNLHEEGLATQQQLDNARTEVEHARDNLRQSEVSIGRHMVHSPVDGHIAERMVDTGEFAAAGVPLVDIIDFDTIVVHARVPESELKYVDQDQQVDLDVDIPAIDATFSGVIDRVALRPSETTRTYEVEIHVENEEHTIRPGMRARTHFQRHHYEETIVVPREAILEGYDGREAMIFDGDDEVGRAQIRTIETGPGTRDDIVVLSGLEPEDRLILRGHRGLVADSPVEIIEQHRQGEQEHN